ncbi:hypothetical protein B0H19DRAFT_1062800 [Mycena capillaripes]|nr:hypothetical protein B0H19DRAFT_1062800 [Mycena capillaripes]
MKSGLSLIQMNRKRSTPPLEDSPDTVAGEENDVGGERKNHQPFDPQVRYLYGARSEYHARFYTTIRSNLRCRQNDSSTAGWGQNSVHNLPFYVDMPSLSCGNVFPDAFPSHWLLKEMPALVCIMSLCIMNHPTVSTELRILRHRGADRASDAMPNNLRTLPLLKIGSQEVGYPGLCAALGSQNDVETIEIKSARSDKSASASCCGKCPGTVQRTVRFWAMTIAHIRSDGLQFPSLCVHSTGFL